MNKIKIFSVVLLALSVSIFCKKDNPFDFSPGQPPQRPAPIDGTLTFRDAIDNKPLRGKPVKQVQMEDGVTYKIITSYTTDDHGKIFFKQDPYTSGTFIVDADDYLESYTHVEAYLRPGFADLAGLYPYNLTPAESLLTDTTKKSHVTALVNRKAVIKITLKQTELIPPDAGGSMYYTSLFVVGFHPVTNARIYGKNIDLPVHLSSFASLNSIPIEEAAIADVAGDVKLKIMFNISKETYDGWDIIRVKEVSDSLITKSNVENRITLTF